MARYEFIEGKSSRFWEATLDGANLIIRFGRIGAAGGFRKFMESR